MIRLLLLPLFIITYQVSAQNWYKVEPESYDFERVELKEDVIDTTRYVNIFRDSIGEIFRQDTSFQTRRIVLDSLSLMLYDYKYDGYGTLTNLSVQSEIGDELFSMNNMVSLTPDVDYYFLRCTEDPKIRLLLLESKIEPEPAFFHTGAILFYKDEIIDLGNFGFVPLDSDGQTRLSYFDSMKLSYQPYTNRIEMEFKAPKVEFSSYFIDNTPVTGASRAYCPIYEMKDTQGNVVGWQMMCEPKFR